MRRFANRNALQTATIANQPADLYKLSYPGKPIGVMLPPWPSISRGSKALRVELHNSEDDRRADTEQQDTIGGL